MDTHLQYHYTIQCKRLYYTIQKHFIHFNPLLSYIHAEHTDCPALPVPHPHAPTHSCLWSALYWGYSFSFLKVALWCKMKMNMDYKLTNLWAINAVISYVIDHLSLTVTQKLRNSSHVYKCTISCYMWPISAECIGNAEI